MQLSFDFDYEAMLNSNPFLAKYDTLFRAFNLIYDDADFPDLGRKGYARSAFLKALIYKESEGIKHMSDLIRDLSSRPFLMMMCGFPMGQIPDASQFSRFLSSSHNSDIQELLHKTVDLLVAEGVTSLDMIIGDSKPIKANTKHNNPKNPSRSQEKTDKVKRNPDATFGYYSYLKQPTPKGKQSSFFWGYRTHVLISKEGIVLVEVTKPNKISDGEVALMLMKKLKRRFGQKKGRKIILDAAYDSNKIYQFIIEEMKAHPYISLNQRGGKNSDKVAESGRPLCEAGLEMTYNGRTKDRDRVRDKYRCPLKHKIADGLPEQCPINHAKFTEGKGYGCTAYIDTKGKHRAQTPRHSVDYKKTYARRILVEQYFSRLGPRECEEMSVFKYRNVRNQMTIAHLTKNLVAIAAAVILNQPDKIRCHKTFADHIWDDAA